MYHVYPRHASFYENLCKIESLPGIGLLRWDLKVSQDAHYVKRNLKLLITCFNAPLLGDVGSGYAKRLVGLKKILTIYKIF